MGGAAGADVVNVRGPAEVEVVGTVKGLTGAGSTRRRPSYAAKRAARRTPPSTSVWPPLELISASEREREMRAMHRTGPHS